MKCSSCNSAKLVEGVMEGLVFSPLSELKKTLARGVYGLGAIICQACGSINELRLFPNALESLKGMNQGINQNTAHLLKGNEMQCKYCSGKETIEGTLEGTYFKPSKEFKRGFMTKSVHHPQATVCISCGRVLRIGLNVVELEEATKLKNK